MTRKTKREQLIDIVRMFGGQGRGKTTSEVIDEIEAAYDDEGHGFAPTTGDLSDDDYDDIFGD